MTHGFQNKYYFLKLCDNNQENNFNTSIGYVSFWECKNTLKITILLENTKLTSVDLYIKGGNTELKLATVSVKKKPFSFQFILPSDKHLCDFDTLYVTRQGKEKPIFKIESQNPCKESIIIKENARQKATDSWIGENRQNKTDSCTEKNRQNETDSYEEEKQQKFSASCIDDVLCEFKEFDPFNTTNDSYKWWVCNDYKMIKETLHNMDIHLPMYADKALYGNMQLFKHALLGRYTGHENRYFLIVGIPVRNLPQKNDSAGPARPMTCSNYYNDTGFEGYLLFYIDYISTAMVKAVVI